MLSETQIFYFYQKCLKYVIMFLKERTDRSIIIRAYLKGSLSN